MNELTTTISSLLATLEPALQKLSEMFCVSMDLIKENAMEYIMMYGRYHLSLELVDTGWKIIWLLIIIGTLSTILIFTFATDSYGNMESDKLNRNKKVIIPIGLLLFIIISIYFIISTCLPYWISPEIYSIKSVLDLMNQGQTL